VTSFAQRRFASIHEFSWPADNHPFAQSSGGFASRRESTGLYSECPVSANVPHDNMRRWVLFLTRLGQAAVILEKQYMYWTIKSNIFYGRPLQNLICSGSSLKSGSKGWYGQSLPHTSFFHVLWSFLGFSDSSPVEFAFWWLRTRESDNSGQVIPLFVLARCHLLFTACDRPSSPCTGVTFRFYQTWRDSCSQYFFVEHRRF
jgi:hypothetical protein